MANRGFLKFEDVLPKSGRVMMCFPNVDDWTAVLVGEMQVQGRLAHKKPQTPRTLPWAYA